MDNDNSNWQCYHADEANMSCLVCRIKFILKVKIPFAKHYKSGKSSRISIDFLYSLYYIKVKKNWIEKFSLFLPFLSTFTEKRWKSSWTTCVLYETIYHVSCTIRMRHDTIIKYKEMWNRNKIQFKVLQMGTFDYSFWFCDG